MENSESDILEDSLYFNTSKSTNKILMLRDYIETNLAGFRNLKDNNFVLAKKFYKRCFMIAQKIGNDSIKIVESYTNLAIACYFNGQFIESKSNLEEAFKLSSNLINDEKLSDLVMQ